MKMILRWFPYGDDSVTLSQIRQIPGVSGVATCLPKVPVGEIWREEELVSLKNTINGEGLEMEVIESVNIHEDIKKGLSSRDEYIDNYITTINNLGKVGVKCLCYNFMPVMDWIRSDLEAPLSDGSFSMSYEQKEVLKMDPLLLSKSMGAKSRGFSLPGWEPERLKQMSSDIEFYKDMSQETYWKNMKYFLDAVIPVAQKNDIKMAIHPDDPPWKLFGLPKVITNMDNIMTFLALNDNPYNGLTFCTGSLGSNPANNIPAMAEIISKMDRIPFAHLRNIKHTSGKDFKESAHLSTCGDLDMFQIVSNLASNGFDGYIRPDHGRMIWGEKARPGYGLYDRAIGSNYLLGLWEAVESFNKNKTT